MRSKLQDGTRYRGIAHFDQRPSMGGIGICAVRLLDRRWWIVARNDSDESRFPPRGPYSLKVAVTIMRVAS